MKSLRKVDLGRSLGSLPGLALAGVICLGMTGPARADFESAVAAYERGAYQEAQTEFETLAAAGDERAEPYLSKIIKDSDGERQTEGGITSTVIDSISSIFSESEPSSDDPESGVAPWRTGWSDASGSSEGGSDRKPADREPWRPVDKSTDSPSLLDFDLAIVRQKSIWSTIFYLPSDATVIGLQYVANLLKADNFSREMQSVSRNGDNLALSILSGFWWLVITRGVVWIGLGVSGLMNQETTTTEQKRYG